MDGINVGRLRELLADFEDHEPISAYSEPKDRDERWDRWEIYGVQSNSGHICRGPRVRLLIVKSDRT